MLVDSRLVLYGECSVVVAAFNNSNAWDIIQCSTALHSILHCSVSLENRDEPIDGIGVLLEGMKCIGIG